MLEEVHIERVESVGVIKSSSQISEDLSNRKQKGQRAP
jgi:hypothetical protein